MERNLLRLAPLGCQRVNTPFLRLQWLSPEIICNRTNLLTSGGQLCLQDGQNDLDDLSGLDSKKAQSGRIIFVQYVVSSTGHYDCNGDVGVYESERPRHVYFSIAIV